MFLLVLSGRLLSGLFLANFLFLGMFMGLFLAGGSRSMVVGFFIFMISLLLAGKRVNVFYLLIVGLIGFLILNFIGYARIWGFSNIEKFDWDVIRIDPLYGELGTQFSVYEKAESLTELKGELLLGKSYTYDVFVNLFRRVVDPGFSTFSQKISYMYYQKEGFGYGLGGSPIVEAKANFGLFGIFLVFFCIMFIVRKFETLFYDKGLWGLFFTSSFGMFALYFQRIDFAIAFKVWAVSLLFIAVAYAFVRVLGCGEYGFLFSSC